MPKWIGSSKRCHPKDDYKKEESEEKALHNGGVLHHQGRGSSGAASLASDSGRSMSASEDSDSELRLGIDWPTVRSMADRQQQQQQPCHETPIDTPLDLSVSGPLGRKNTTTATTATTAAVSSLLSRRYYPIAIDDDDDDEVKVHAAVTSETDVRLLEEMNNRRRRLPLLLSQETHLKNYGARWDVAPRHLRLYGNSFSGEKVTKKRHHVTVEDDDDDGGGGGGEGRGRIPEVHATPEAVAQLQRIENKIGEYKCMLCGNQYDDAFDLANHNCSCIVKIVHRCPECNKVFQCPANLASHRRWHGIRGAHLEQSFPSAPEAAAAAAAAKASSLSASACT